jgi:hypothetical protein
MSEAAFEGSFTLISKAITTFILLYHNNEVNKLYEYFSSRKQNVLILISRSFNKNNHLVKLTL